MIEVPGYRAGNPWVDAQGRLTVAAQAWLAGLVGAVRELQVAAEAGAATGADVQAVQEAATLASVGSVSVPFVL